MNRSSLLAELDELGVQIWAAGDRLRYKPRSAVDPALQQRLAAHKGEILQQLRSEAHQLPILRPRVLIRSPSGVEIVEIEQVDPPGPTRWERRVCLGAVALVTDITGDRKLARLWAMGLLEDAKDAVISLPVIWLSGNVWRWRRREA